jgi:hypothetical protein
MLVDDPGVSLVTLLLADYANVREGLLNVVSAGITRVAPRGSYPFHPDVFLAMMAYVQPDRIDEAHEARVTLKYPETAEKVAQIDFSFSASAAHFPGEGLYVPFAIPLRDVVFPHPGEVDVSVTLNGQYANSLTFWLQEPARTD